MIHLTAADYTRQPWKNGKGTTTELYRVMKDGQLLARLSRASVVEDGAFSLFPGVERNLTVLTGAGFRLTGPGINLRCDPLVPVAFPGDLPVSASETGNRRSDDFNVMTARHLPRPEVAMAHPGTILPAGGLLALYALGPAMVNDVMLAPGDLVLAETAAVVASPSPVLAARLFGL